MDRRPYLQAPGIRDLTTLFGTALARTDPNNRLSDQPDLLKIIIDYLGRQTISATVEYVKGSRGLDPVPCLCCKATDCAEYFKLVYQPRLNVMGEMVDCTIINSMPSTLYNLPRCSMTVCYACSRSPTAIYSIGCKGDQVELFSAYVPDIHIERNLKKKPLRTLFDSDTNNKFKRSTGTDQDQDFWAIIQPFFISIDGEVRKVRVCLVYEMMLDSDFLQHIWESMTRFCDLDEFEPLLRAELLDMSKVRTRCF